MSRPNISVFGDKAVHVQNIIKSKFSQLAQIYNMESNYDNLKLFSSNIVLLCINSAQPSFVFANKKFESIKNMATNATFILVQYDDEKAADETKIETFKKENSIEHHLSFSKKTTQKLIKDIENIPVLKNAHRQKSYEENHKLLITMLINSTVFGLALFSAGLAVKFIVASNPIFMSLCAASAVFGVVSLSITGSIFKNYIDQKRKESAPVVTAV